MDLHLRGRDAALAEELDVAAPRQRLPAFEKLARTLIDHVDGILNYCRVKVRFGVVEAINGNIRTLLRPRRGYKNLRYMLLKAQRMAATKIEFVIFRKAA